MTKDEFLIYLEREIKRRCRVRELTRTLEPGKTYEMSMDGSHVLGRVTGFTHSHSDLSLGVVVHPLAVKNHYGILQKSLTIQFGYGSYLESFKFKPVLDTDLPKYLGWDTNAAFASKLKRLKPCGK